MEVVVIGMGIVVCGILAIIMLFVIATFQLQLIIRLLDDLVDRTPLDHLGFMGQRRKRN